MAQQAGEGFSISPKMIDWLLYNLPGLRAQVAETEPRTSTSVIIFSSRNIRLPSSAVESIAIKRAAVSAVLDVVESGIKSLHPEQRKIYRMKYRASKSYKQISRNLYISEETVGRRLAEIRVIVAHCIQQVSRSDFKEFARFFMSRD
jgi:DNA-directed RNA polymerase specialized sigma24 family protein